MEMYKETWIDLKKKLDFKELSNGMGGLIWNGTEKILDESEVGAGIDIKKIQERSEKNFMWK